MQAFVPTTSTMRSCSWVTTAAWATLLVSASIFVRTGNATGPSRLIAWTALKETYGLLPLFASLVKSGRAETALLPRSSKPKTASIPSEATMRMPGHR